LIERERFVLEEKNRLDIERNKEKAIIEKLKNQTNEEGGDNEMKIFTKELFSEVRDDLADSYT
jgi:hypothetical protein